VKQVGVAADDSIRRYLGFDSTELPGRGDRTESMAGKKTTLSLGQIADALKAKGFEVSETGARLRVSKIGCAAVLVASGSIGQSLGTSTGSETSVAYAEGPGAAVQGEIARLLDRGYQKFLKTSKYEVPATAAQLQAIHQFTEEVALVTGGVSLYNEALGTTSDLYQYDRIKGRETPVAGKRPWELAGGH
jgi:hypothetical protein